MSVRVRLLLALAATLALSGCAYRPLKAPCAPDEGGVPVAYTALTGSTTGDGAARDRCGSMRPI